MRCRIVFFYFDLRYTSSGTIKTSSRSPTLPIKLMPALASCDDIGAPKVRLCSIACGRDDLPASWVELLVDTDDFFSEIKPSDSTITIVSKATGRSIGSSVCLGSTVTSWFLETFGVLSTLSG